MVKLILATTVPLSLDIFCKGLLKELSEDYEVVALSSPGELLDSVARREGVRTIAVPMARHISVIKDFKALLSLIKVFKAEKPDMIHSMTPKAGLLCMVASMLSKVPVRVHTFTGLVFPTASGIKKEVLKLTDRITCACATNVIPEGEGVKQDLIKNNITNKPLKILGYGNVRGVDLEYYNRTPEVEEQASLIRDSHLFTFLFVGRLVQDKGINELIEAFDKLHDDYPQTRLFLVGPYEDSLDPISDKTRIVISENNDILAVGLQSGIELLSYYAASDCFVLPSHREGFPNTVLEAGAFGLPCIVTDINGSREIITNGYNGLVIPVHDSEALYEAMKSMIENKEMHDSMASVSRAHIASHYEQGFVRKCLFDYYKEVLS